MMKTRKFNTKLMDKQLSLSKKKKRELYLLFIQYIQKDYLKMMLKNKISKNNLMMVNEYM